MRHLHAAIRVAALLPILALGTSYTASATQGTQAAPSEPTDSLLSQLTAQYKTTKVGNDASGMSIVEQGTVLVIQKGGILGVPPNNLTIGATTFKDGQVHSPGFGQVMLLGQNTRLLQSGEKVYVLKIQVDFKNDRVALAIMECDSCNGLNQLSSYKANVAFQYPKGYLSSADPSQVIDVITQLLAPDTGSGDNQQTPNPQDQQQGNAPSQTPPQVEAPPQPPPTIQVGESIADVTAALGQPKKIVDLGAKKIYVYEDLKITFMNGKVSNVE